ncbi:MAG TPA: NAD-dependent epimerase/dehydratase family protein [Chloroflexota bacterium]|nr:NAD-dependent epimerase/dehydratase family protein [Chloroflexota bacterium]
MRVLVTGGTGFIGGAIVQALLAAGGAHEVSILSRRASAPGATSGPVARVAGDVRDPASLRRAVEGVDTVVHCVQFPNHPVENPRRGYTYAAIDGQGTVNLAAACREAGVRRLLYLSGAGTRPGRSEPWFQAKATAEQAVRDSGREWVIFRPSWVYGPRDRSLNRFVQLVRLLPVVPVIGNGQTRVQPVLVDDVARVVAAAVDEPRATGQVFELGGPERLTMDEILRTVQRVLGRHQPLVHVPVGLVKLQAALLALLPNPPLSPAAIDFILMEETVDPRPAEALFGVTFRDLEAGLRTYLGARGPVQRPAAGPA